MYDGVEGTLGCLEWSGCSVQGTERMPTGGQLRLRAQGDPQPPKISSFRPITVRALQVWPRGPPMSRTNISRRLTLSMRHTALAKYSQKLLLRPLPVLHLT